MDTHYDGQLTYLLSSSSMPTRFLLDRVASVSLVVASLLVSLHARSSPYLAPCVLLHAVQHYPDLFMLSGYAVSALTYGRSSTLTAKHRASLLGTDVKKIMEHLPDKLADTGACTPNFVLFEKFPQRLSTNIAMATEISTAFIEKYRNGKWPQNNKLVFFFFFFGGGRAKSFLSLLDLFFYLVGL